MKKLPFILPLVFMILLSSVRFSARAQCSICTKTTQQLGEKPAKGLNAGILYLAFAPFAIAGFVAFKWWKNHQATNDPRL
jgi:hypothetical protein